MGTIKDSAEAIARGRLALGVSNVALAEELGCSRRTMQRWIAGESSVATSALVHLARLVLPRDRALAEAIYERANATLVSIGLDALAPLVPPEPPPAAPLPPPPPPAPPPRPPEITNAVVCAAAEAMNLPPGTLRPALVAAFKCARALGLSVAEVEEGLAAV